jgi:4-amino-4-deoxy-L-arabinose transferase-like glycosyltransferase
MKSLVISIVRDPRLLLISILVLTTPIKIYYALSRPLFYSGPDANGYIPAMQDFGSKPFLSPDISYQPGYPPGYPYLISLFYRITKSDWIPIAQSFQIILFTISIYLFFLLIRNHTTTLIAQISSFVLAFSPAWAVASGEAMYESTYFSLLVIALYTLLPGHETPKPLRSFVGGILLGSVVVVHPRGLLVVLILVVYFQFIEKKRNLFKCLVGLGFLIPYLIFSFRNLIAEKSFTLSSAVWASVSANPYLTGCQSILCVAERGVADPISFIAQCFWNICHFWSPYSWPLMRGTWYHNVSLFSILTNNDMVFIATLLSYLLMISIFIGWVVGTFLLHRVSPKTNFILASIVLASILNDALVYGDSRHRLAVMAFILPALAISLLKLIEKIVPKSKLARIQI